MNKVLNAIRLFSMLLALAAVGAWAMWEWAPHQVQMAEDAVIQRYMRASSQGLSRAREVGKAGDWDKAVELLEDQAEELRRYKKLDRLFRLRRRTIQQLAVAAAKAGDPLRASKWVRKFLKDDPKDIPLAIQSADLLIAADSIEAHIAGRKQYSELFAWLPLVSSIAKGHIGQLAIHANQDDLVQALAQHLEHVERPAQVMQNLQFGWFFRSGGEVDLSKSPRTPLNPLRDGGGLLIPFEVPTQSRFLRLDFPAYSVAELSSARIDFGTEIAQLAEPIQMAGLEWRDDKLSAVGRASSWAVYALPIVLGEGKSKGTLRFNLAELPSWLEPHLGSAAGRSLQNLCIEQGEWKKYGLLRRSWIRSRESTPIRIRGAKGSPVFKHTMKKIGMAVEFNCHVQFTPSTSELVVVLPLALGDVLKLDRFDLHCGATQVQWKAGDENRGFVMDGIEWLDGLGLVTKDRPQIRWKSVGSASVNSLNLRGQVK
ncbi:MAG: hypothetical protein JKY61_12615 [Planctomycetes bacterium]|nr:hypothetical protein [Planctomycetota bacterium]